MISGWQSQAQAQGEASFVVAVGAAGTDSFVFGTELWAVSQIELQPKHRLGLETVEVRSPEGRLRRLDNGQVDFAFVRNDVSSSFARDLSQVMALWPGGVTRAGVEPTHLLVRKDVSDEAVYQLTRMMFEHAEKLDSAHPTIGISSPSTATTGLVLPIHPGAHRYYRHRGWSSDHDPTLISDRPEVSRSHGAIDYDELADSELLQLKAACEDAGKREVLEAVDGDELIEACSPFSAGAEGVRSMDLTRGQGGPQISISASEETGWAWDVVSYEIRPKTLKPTM
ncbi:MAG: TAXI family TRAP transporter solute-binding subunit [Geminicoccaceae bacterium]